PSAFDPRQPGRDGQIKPRYRIQKLRRICYGGVEIRHQYAAEAVEHVSQKIALARRPKDINGGVRICADPYVTGPSPQLDFRFVDVQHRTCKELRQEAFIRPAIVAGEQVTEGQEFRRIHVDPENVIEKRPQGFYA